MNGDPKNPCVGLPTEYVEGEWCLPTDDSDPAAVVTYAGEPSPETGLVGWQYWALGHMGEADSYEDAKARAERWIRARINGMPASGRWA